MCPIPCARSAVDPAPVLLLGADLRVETCRVGDVVAVRASGHRLEIRRRVAVADAQAREVVDDLQRVPESEGRVELKPVCRNGNAWRAVGRGEVHQQRSAASRAPDCAGLKSDWFGRFRSGTAVQSRRAMLDSNLLRHIGVRRPVRLVGLASLVLAGAAACAHPEVRRTVDRPPTRAELTQFWIDPADGRRDLVAGAGAGLARPQTDGRYEIVERDTRGLQHHLRRARRAQRRVERQDRTRGAGRSRGLAHPLGARLSPAAGLFRRAVDCRGRWTRAAAWRRAFPSARRARRGPGAVVVAAESVCRHARVQRPAVAADADQQHRPEERQQRGLRGGAAARRDSRRASTSSRTSAPRSGRAGASIRGATSSTASSASRSCADVTASGSASRSADAIRSSFGTSLSLISSGCAAASSTSPIASGRRRSARHTTTNRRPRGTWRGFARRHKRGWRCSERVSHAGAHLRPRLRMGRAGSCCAT